MQNRVHGKHSQLAVSRRTRRTSCTTRGVRFHESLVEASGNVFFIGTIKRVKRVRRLLSYRSMQHRARYKKHCKRHLHILALLEKERNEEASEALREHLQHARRTFARRQHSQTLGSV